MADKDKSDKGWFHKVTSKDGETWHNYFGPKGESDHGHVVVNSKGEVQGTPRDSGEQSGKKYRANRNKEAGLSRLLVSANLRISYRVDEISPSQFGGPF